MSREGYFKHKQAYLMAAEARDRWGDEFTKQVIDYNDGDTAIVCYHVAGYDEDGRTRFEELRWHSGRMKYGEAEQRVAVSADPDAARNETVQRVVESGVVVLEAQSDL